MLKLGIRTNSTATSRVFTEFDKLAIDAIKESYSVSLVLVVTVNNETIVEVLQEYKPEQLLGKLSSFLRAHPGSIQYGSRKLKLTDLAVEDRKPVLLTQREMQILRQALQNLDQ
jgi:hypothetical protein